MNIAPDKPPSNTGSKLTTEHDSAGNTLTLNLVGRLDSANISPLWRQAADAIKTHRPPPARIRVNAADVTYCDVSGAAFLVDLQRRHENGQAAVAIENLPEQFRPVLALFNPDDFPHEPPPPPKAAHPIENIGKHARKAAAETVSLVDFTGAVARAGFRALLNPRKIRWRDTFLVAERAGADALPIIMLLSFLMGLILSFAAAIPMRQFGVEIYVADLVAIAMLRELGPLLTCIILAGRSGSAFAAEIGTMKVREEINALKTMSLDPVSFLVLPRILASIAVAPLLTIFANILGLVGSAVVILSLGYPLVTYVNKILGIMTLADFTQGLVKAFVFAFLVSAVGCLRGLQTGNSPDAVGVSATRAVVSGITLIIICDGVFAVILYILGI